MDVSKYLGSTFLKLADVKASGPIRVVAYWIDKEIELNVGETKYQGKPQESILITPISPPVDKKAWVDDATPTRRIRRGPANDMDDDIAF